ncbi:hypothetical protein O181_116513 [Austropuccinia psidii MF-1]|uniref:Uncharacterized protein n=1 Tax=Austropuccinia psidii MF-1 TaxID=1389203 RepID=A0A9Q3PWL8_9BASI|nr:hypothetical protein [Austropuccinia psidii MF-1]
MSAPPTPYKCIKAPPRRSVCPDLDNTNLTSSPPDIMPYLNAETRGWIHKIHELGKQSRIAPKKPYLLPQDFQQCLAFAQAHRHWTINDWAQVIWTDNNASTPGLSQQSNDIDQDVAASLSTGPAPVHSLDGAGPLDTWSPTHPTDGG